MWQIMTKQRNCVVTAELILHAFHTNWINEMLCVIFPRPPSRCEWVECFFLGVVVVVGTPPSTNICLFIISSFWFHWNVQQKKWFCFFKIFGKRFSRRCIHFISKCHRSHKSWLRDTKEKNEPAKYEWWKITKKEKTKKNARNWIRNWNRGEVIVRWRNECFFTHFWLDWVENDDETFEMAEWLLIAIRDADGRFTFFAVTSSAATIHFDLRSRSVASDIAFQYFCWIEAISLLSTASINGHIFFVLHFVYFVWNRYRSRLFKIGKEIYMNFLCLSSVIFGFVACEFSECCWNFLVIFDELWKKFRFFFLMRSILNESFDNSFEAVPMNDFSSN